MILVTAGIANASSVTVNSDRTISVDGTKIFPIGAYVETDWAGLVGLGVNSVSDPFCFHPASITKCEANFVYCHLTVGSGCDDQNAQDIKNRASSAFINSVNQIKNSPFLLGYGLPDEPVSSMGLSTTDTLWAYNTIKSADPNHLVFLTDYASDVSSYKNSADVFLNDEYPFNNDPNPLYDIKTKYQKMLNQVSPKPAWIIIQTGSQFGVPTNSQIRAETYLSIVLGSTGIIFYSYDVVDASAVHNIKKDGDPAYMKNLMSELKSFSSYFLAPTSSKLSYTSSDIDAVLKDYNSKLYLIAVNKASSSRSVTFTITGAGSTTAKIIGTAAAGSSRAGQSIVLTSDKLTDNLQGLEAVVYEINGVTSDTTPPTRLSGAPTGTITTSTATLSLNTNEAATCRYSTSSGVAYNSMTSSTTASDTSHSWSLSGLTSGTKYYYVKCKDTAGNMNADDYTISFTVSSTSSDTTPPTISAVSASSITSSGATILWTTNEAADAQVDYGTTASYGSSTTLTTSLVTSQSRTLSGLSASITYHYRVRSKDAAGNIATSSDNTFVTSCSVSSSLDKFGIKNLYATASCGREWFSTWDNGQARSWDDTQNDPYDAEFNTQGKGTGSWKVDGAGILKISGLAPRMYVYDDAQVKNWHNVEVTLYGYRVADDNTAWGGLEAVTRTNHLNDLTMPCDTRGIDARMRYDEHIDFEKETSHPDSVAVSNKINPGGFPKNVWIGYKLVVYDMPDGNVKLELYRDDTNGLDGGTWVKINELIDTGSNFGVGGTACKSGISPALKLTSSDIRQGSETGKPNLAVYFRSDGVGTDGLWYKKASIREISPVLVPPPTDTIPPTISAVSSSSITSSGATITWNTNEAADAQVDYGTSASYGSSTTLTTSLVTSQSRTLSGLSASTTYHYRVRSKDAAGNLATSADNTFTTAASTSAPNPSPILTTITVSPSTTSVSVGATKQFTDLSKDQFGSPISTSVTWSSSNNAVGTVTQSGLFTATSQGTTIITASSGGVSGTATVTVTAPITLMQILVSPTSATTQKGATYPFKAYPKDQNGNTYQTVIAWTSSNTTVGTIDSSGMFSAMTPGDTVITASSGSISKNVNVKVIELTVGGVSGGGGGGGGSGGIINMQSIKRSFENFLNNLGIYRGTNGVYKGNLVKTTSASQTSGWFNGIKKSWNGWLSNTKGKFS